ncbi:chromosomal replication initiator protein DnaA [Candidatus Roizmanbacteria bacterium]|nr:chromosomal replication initiator protein DnaA [Candidatus Roizmanbacteria bacterium]
MSLLGSFWNEFLTKFETNKDKSSVLYSVLKQTHLVELTEEKIVVGCDNQGVKKFLDPKLREVEEKIYLNFKKKLSLEFIIAPIQRKKVVPPLLSFEPPVEDLFIRSGLNKKYSFENFAVSPTNQVAYAAAQAVVNNLGTAYNPLFLYGGVGVGKTHLAQAVAKKILEAEKNKKIYFCPGDNFTNELIESIREKSTPRFRRKYRYLDLLLIDDIQFIAGKIHVQEEFFHTFNSIVSNGGQVILTSDRPPTSIKNLEDRLRSRFSGGLTVDIQSPDFELRTAILLIKAKEKNITLDIEAAKIIAERTSDSRTLEGVLLSLYAKILGKKDQVDLESVEEFFSQKEDGQAKRILPSDIIKAVCAYYNVRPSHLKSRERTDSIALPRQVAMYLIRKHLGLKLVEIAEILKRKDHTTVLHAEEKVSNLIMRDQNFKKDLDNIIQTFEVST